MSEHRAAGARRPAGYEAESTFSSWAGPSFVRGQGCWLYDEAGAAYFDASGGSGALNLGHQHPIVVEAIVEQSRALIHTGCKVQSAARRGLMERLARVLPFDDPAVLPTVIGTEAVEAALKVARAYTGRRLVVALDRSYHGKSTGGLSVTWRESIKRHSAIDRSAVLGCPAPLGDEGPGPFLQTMRERLHRAAGEGNPAAAVIIEPVQATEGVHVLGPAFLRGVADVAREAGALVIFDEIYTGFGRTGTMFYAEQAGVTPDLMVIGKALANGLPIGAVAGRASVVNALGSGVQTSTFSGQPLACAVASRVLEYTLAHRLHERAARAGEALRADLRALAAERGRTSAPRGAGLMIGFDCLGPDGAPSAAAAEAFGRRSLAAGLVIYVGGHQGASVRVTPPLVMSDEDRAQLVARLAEAIGRGDPAATDKK